MQKKLSLDDFFDAPRLGSKQTITIVTEGDKKNNLPPCELHFITKLEGTIPYVASGSCTILDRDQTDVKQYPKLSSNIVITYNSKNQVVKVEFGETGPTTSEDEDETDAAKEGHKELVSFLETAGDIEALHMYRIIGFYWTSIQSGISLSSGHLEDILVEGLEDLPDPEDL